MDKNKFTMAEYELLWRPNVEIYQVVIWAVSAIVTLVAHYFINLPATVFYYFTGACLFMLIWRGWPAIKNHFRLQKLRKVVLEFISPKKHKAILSKRPEELWLGSGFNWESFHTQLAFDLIKVNPRAFANIQDKEMGAPWLHGLADKEEDLFVPMDHLEGHSLIVGTTGSGKTRLLDLICSAAVRRTPKEALIVIDPKGDRDLREGLRKACNEMGEPERFVLFHPAFPEESVRINPLLNFTRATELGSRITALIDDDGADAFTNFGQMAITNIVSGLVQSGKKPTLRGIRRVIEVGPEKLLINALESYLRSIIDDAWVSEVATKETGFAKSRLSRDEARVSALISYYRNSIPEEKASSDLEGLVGIYEHDRVHFGKMITSLMPILTMLTAGELGDILSPREGMDTDDPRQIVDTQNLINEGKVFYIGLDSLSDNMVAKMVGSMLLADMASVAGARYNYDNESGYVNLIVDEAAEVINKPTIQLLNKGRGARFRMTIATQTFQDFSAALNSQAEAEQVLANCNNLIALRTLDSVTQLYITDSIPTTRVRYIMQTQAAGTDSSEPILFSGNHGERLMEEEVPLFAPQWLGMLPNLHYIGKVSGGRIIKGRLPILIHDLEEDDGRFTSTLDKQIPIGTEDQPDVPDQDLLDEEIKLYEHD